MDIIENKNYDEERALYNIKDTEIKNCIFSGPLDQRICSKRNKKYCSK